MQKVIFRKFPDGQIIALFPELAADSNPFNCLSYMTIGQHAAASPDIVRTTREAKPEEYKPLLSELVRAGYDDIKPVKKFTYGDFMKRKGA